MQLLSTKLSMPLLRARLVARSRLIQKLNQGLDCGLTLISAPAGYGKSTLVTAWLSYLGASAAWYALDDSDNDPVRFLTYLAAALEKMEPSAGKALESSLHASPLPEIEILLTPVVNELAQVERPFYLVLDDYHVIKNQAVHQGIRFLLEHRPPGLHLVLATRADPPLPLSRLRARAQILELRQADLCFTAPEAADFLSHTMGVRVSSEDAARITRRTEGWIAGLQMAALSMQSMEDVSGFINTLTGNHRYIFDYLLEEILERQSPDIRRFLLHTSILDQLTPELCDALLTGEESRSSAVILKELDQANLFILPLDHEHRWYRYHHLFSDLLRLMLEQTHPGLSTEIHRRACRWYEAQGMLAEALHHALSSMDMQLVAQIVSANVLALVDNDEIAPILQRMDAAPHEQRASLPWLCVAYAWALAYAGQMERAETALQQAEAHQAELAEDEGERMLGHIGAVRAYVAWVHGDQQQAVERAMEAALHLPLEEYAVRALNVTTLGNALTQYEAEPRAVEVLEQAVALARQAGQSHVFMPAATALVYAYFRMGMFNKSHAICLEALEQAEEYQRQKAQILPAVASVYAYLSVIFCEWGEFEKSIQIARKGLALSEQWGQADTTMLCLLTLADGLSLAKETDESLRVLQRARELARKISSWFLSGVEFYEMRVRLDAGQLDQAASLAPKMGEKLLPSLKARLLLKQNRIDEALAVIEHALPEALSAPSLEAVRLGAIKALALFLKRAEPQALSTLAEVLVLAEAENRISVFVREGESMAKLLRLALSQSISPDFVQKLLAAFEIHPAPLLKPAPAVAGLVEPLSARELELLKLLAQGCSDKKIAETLVIARETVHKHLKNIYGKLDVHSRTEAAARAHELGLI